MPVEKHLPFLEKVLTQERLNHSLGVMQVMSELAEVYGLDQEKAKTIGILHDAAKDLPQEKIDRILKTKLVVVICLFLLLVAQVHHTVYVYSMATHEPTTPWYAWCYAIGIEGAILVFVVNGWRWQSMLFSLATILTNFLYGEYGQKEIPLAVNVTISVLLGGAIAGFSHLYYTKMKLIESIIDEVENGNTEDEKGDQAERVTAEVLQQTKLVLQGIQQFLGDSFVQDPYLFL